MSTLTENATALALGLAIKHISKEPTLADAEVFLVGRPHLWIGWESASEVAREQIITLIKYRPVDLNQTGRFLDEARRIIFGAGSPFRAAGADLLVSQEAPPPLTETDVYCFQEGFDLDGLIEEKLCAIKVEFYYLRAKKKRRSGPSA